MATRSHDSCLQVFGVRACLQHLFIVVSFQNKIVRIANHRLHLIAQEAYVGHHAEHNALTLNAIAHVVGAIMRHAKWGYKEIANLYGHVLLNNLHQR